MKKGTLLLGLVVLFVTACIKEKQNIIPPNDDDNTVNDTPIIVQPTDTGSVDTSNKGLRITGLKDINVPGLGIDSIEVTVVCDTCDGIELFLSVTGQEDNDRLKMYLTKKSGIDSFKSTLAVKSLLNRWGTYVIELFATDKKTIDTRVRRYIKIKEPSQSECNEYLYTATGHGSFDKTTHINTNYVPVDSLLPNQYVGMYYNEQASFLYLVGMTMGYSSTSQEYIEASSNIFASYNCSSYVFEIPEQTIKGQGSSIYFTIKGQGTIDMEKRICEVEYRTTFNDGGSNVIQHFKITSDIINL